MEELLLLALNVHGMNGLRHTEMHTAETLISEPSFWGVEIAIEKLKICKSLGIDQILAQLSQAEGKTLQTY
jgi:hypothetical protein